MAARRQSGADEAGNGPVPRAGGGVAAQPRARPCKHGAGRRGGQRRSQQAAAKRGQSPTGRPGRRPGAGWGGQRAAHAARRSGHEASSPKGRATGGPVAAQAEASSSTSSPRPARAHGATPLRGGNARPTRRLRRPAAAKREAGQRGRPEKQRVAAGYSEEQQHRASPSPGPSTSRERQAKAGMGGCRLGRDSGKSAPAGRPKSVGEGDNDSNQVRFGKQPGQQTDRQAQPGGRSIRRGGKAEPLCWSRPQLLMRTGVEPPVPGRGWAALNEGE